MISENYEAMAMSTQLGFANCLALIACFIFSEKWVH